MRTVSAPVGVTWIVPNYCQGRIVEYAYGIDVDRIAWRRITDRSDQSVKYAVADVPEVWDPAEGVTGANWEVVCVKEEASE